MGPEHGAKAKLFQDAEEAYADYVQRRRAGEELAFDDFCAKTPAHLESALRSLHSVFKLGQSVATSKSFRETIRARFGTDAEVTFSVDPDDRSDVAPAPRAKERYENLGEVARGGMGVILRVRDHDLNRTLAMKVMLRSAGGGKQAAPLPDELTRFLEEAQVTAQLDHPGIVPVHELGFDAEGRIYFTMQLVKGRSFGEILDLAREEKEGWNRPRAVGVLVKACQAMAYAHAKRVVHRDLKPANIMVGRFGEVYVMDWGVAKIIGKEDLRDLRLQPQSMATFTSIRSDRRQAVEEGSDGALVTMDGMVVGTPAFMPPEQAAGRVDEIDQRSDVYSLGAILYNLLCGQAPYVPPGALVSPRTVLGLVLQGPPAPVLELAPKAPLELVAICDKAMDRRMKHRYATSLEMAEDLQAYLDDRVVRAYEAGALDKARKWVARNKAKASALATAATLLVAGLLVVMFLQRRHLEEVLQLSDVKLLADCNVEVEKLWPAVPGKIPEMERWLARAERLSANLPEHRETLEALRVKALPYDEEARERDRLSHPQATVLAALEKDHAALLAEKRDLERRVGRGARATVLSYGSDPTKKATTYYFRHRFAANDLPPDAVVRVNVAVDDGAVVFLNGVSVLRLNMPEAELRSDTRAVAAIRDPREEEHDLPAHLLLPGTNVLAAEVHQANARSSDLCFSLELAVGERRLIGPDAEWRYLDGGRQPAGGWQERDFADASWSTGVAPLGYGFIDGPGRLLEIPAAVATLEKEISRLEALVSGQRSWRFANTKLEWQHDTLSDLVEALEVFTDADPKRGVVASVRERLEFARTVRERTIEAFAAEWNAVIRSIADRSECPAYDGLEIEPQVGLVPLGRDPDSGLWEFAHLQTGAIPRRGVHDKLERSEEMGLVFVLIPAGSFRMGADKPSDPSGSPDASTQAGADEGPVHEVHLDAFFLSKYEMTQGQWLRFTGENPSRYGPEERRGGKQHSLLHPLELVSWERCHQVLSRLGLVLPSEAQWEYAARGGRQTSWWTGDAQETLAGAANLRDSYLQNHGGPPRWTYDEWFDDGYAAHAPVGSYRANPFGLHDVVGNVSEWCLDGHGSYEVPVRKGTGERRVEDPDNRVYRGGGWVHTAEMCRSAKRYGGTPGFSYYALGVRPARRID